MRFRDIFKMSVKAAGLIVFREIQPKKFEYLLLKCTNGKHWTPPKGHVDAGEDEKMAAIRETKEEAGLSAESYDVVNGYEHTLEYKAWGKNKTVKYWLARLKNNDAQVKLSSEHTDFGWFRAQDLQDGKYIDGLFHDNTKSLIRNSEEFLNGKQ